MGLSISRNVEERRKTNPHSPSQNLGIRTAAQNTNTNPHRPDGLYKFPSKVRAIIFFYVLYDSWHGKSPNFLRALRGDCGLYFEALPVFYKHNVYELQGIHHLKRGREVGFLRSVQNLRFKIPLKDPRFSTKSNNLQVSTERTSLLKAVKLFRPEPSNRLYFSLVGTWPLPRRDSPRFSLADAINMYVNYAERLETMRRCFERFRQKCTASSGYTSVHAAPILSIAFEEPHVRRSGLVIHHLLEYLRFYIPMREQRLASVNSSGSTTWEWETEWGNDLVMQFRSAHPGTKRREWHLPCTIREMLERDHEFWVQHCLQQSERYGFLQLH
ncbi:uncharacterized protein EAE97_010591 [Botrytis byssoidea]|uniref:Uncharacterized protein n=1 Tax=Botrytis byssoidea TaxID=139641 RepID=A0A9P5I1K7_9HELO|nr:uncharacterized protein EAE97_010591 [Botrytis byssoidea]KAF7924640.1 hypothetical protein EAE97_010591 [Botrytis byssoidea]